MTELCDGLTTRLLTTDDAQAVFEVIAAFTLGRTLKKRAVDVAHFDQPGTSNGPTEAINGCLEHLRGSALGFRNLTTYIARSLLETGGFRPGAGVHRVQGRDGVDAVVVLVAGVVGVGETCGTQGRHAMGESNERQKSTRGDGGRDSGDRVRGQWRGRRDDE